MAVNRKPKNTLKFSQPSSWWGSRWREGIPLGSGVIGASVYGGAADDTVMITHGDLWWQGKDSALQDVADKIPAVRKKLDEGDFLGAEKMLSTELIRKGYRPQLSYPLPLCDFNIEMKVRGTKEYSRTLDMENAEATVMFKDGATRYERNTFVSRARDLIVYEISRTGQKNIDATFRLALHDKFNARTPVAVSATPENVTTKCEPHWLYFSARSTTGSDFGAVAMINYFSGKEESDGDGISVIGAEKIFVVIKPFIETARDKAWKDCKAALTEIKKLSYDKLLKEHQALHQKLFNSAEVDFCADGDERDEFVDRAITDAVRSGEIDAATLEKIWAFGRYLMITGTRQGARPFAPYGLWCGDYKAESAQINAAGRLQGVYDMAQSGNLCSLAESVFDMYEAAMPQLKLNASRLYGCRGIFIPYTMSASVGYPGDIADSMIHFTGVAGWVGNLFYDYALYTNDQKFLKTRALPFMKEAATFYEEFFKLADLRYYESSPSYSPFTTAGNLAGTGEEHAIAKNATVDFAIARSLLTNLIEGSKAAGMNKQEVIKWEDMLKKIPPYKYNSDGTVCEYIDDRCTDNPLSPSLALFYPVYPDYRNRDNFELTKSFAETARKKGVTARESMTAESLAVYANIYARLGDANMLYEQLTALVRGMAMNNLMFASDDWRGMGSGKTDIWAQPAPYANVMAAGAIQEALVQSTPDTILLLPAVPNEMSKGSLSGFQTRANVEISDMEWDIQRGTLSVKLKAKRATVVDLQLPKTAKPPKKVDAQKFDDLRGMLVGLKLAANKVVALDIRF